MAIEIPQHIKEVINNPESIKVLATVSKDGIPHVVFKGSLKAIDDSTLLFLEFIESSQTNKNMIHSIWFNKTVSVNVLLGKESFQLKGKVQRAIVAGNEFEKYYNQVQESKKIDLSTVYKIDVEEVVDQSFEKRRVEEFEKHPIFQHLDLITKQ